MGKSDDDEEEDKKSFKVRTYMYIVYTYQLQLQYQLCCMYIPSQNLVIDLDVNVRILLDKVGRVDGQSERVHC